MSTRLPPTHRRAAGGFSLVEVLVATVILVLALLGSVGTLSTVNSLELSSRESIDAYQAARAVIERLQGEPLQDVLARHNADTDDDPAGAGTAPGPNFAVAGLDVRADDVDGFAGRIIFPLDDTGALIESTVDAAFGMPMDLNGDGVAGVVDRRTDHVLLPVRVRIEWTGKSGRRAVELGTVLGLRR